MCKNTIYKLKRRIWEVFFVRWEIPFKSQRLGHYLWFFALKLLFMKNAENFKVLDSIQKIYEKSKDSELKIEILHTFEDLPFLMDFFNLQEIETVLYCIFFVDYVEGSRRRRDTIWEHLNLKNLDVLKFESQIEVLLKKKLLKTENRRGPHAIMTRNGYNPEYIINENHLDNILKNIKIKELNPNAATFLDAMEYFEHLKTQNQSNERALEVELQVFFNENKFQTLKFLKKQNLKSYQQYFMLTAILDAIDNLDNDYNTDIQRTLQDFFDSKGKTFMQYKKIIKKEDALTANNLIEVGESNFRGMCSCKLSDEIIHLLKEDGVEIDNTSQKSKENTKLLYHTKIAEKTLFYNPIEEIEIQTLENALQKKQFENLQKRLSEKAMPVGITALFYGTAGTGKTESVYQMAKKTGRNIYKVDISETKSMWFGQSQKLVKGIFNTYAELKAEEENCPILLFNEADGIIGKRKPAGSTSVADTENAIQNILLEELEKFDGILMATTNLHGNIDAAFERRFLYKVKFEKPKVENAKKIWQNKFEFLQENEAEILAKKLDFSGGEMENVARKILMNEVLNDEKPSYEKILQLCDVERWNEGKKVGF